jgi:pyruvate dehydrogenase E2 component (dihydrolipoamide acetyltransferase)
MAGIETIVMPKWGLAMQEGMVAVWNVDVGAVISKGQEIMDIETSKIANALERVLVHGGSEERVGRSQAVL